MKSDTFYSSELHATNCYACIDFRIYTTFMNDTRWSIVLKRAKWMRWMNECFFYDRRNVAYIAFIHTCETDIKKKITTLNERFDEKKKQKQNKEGWAARSACVRNVTHSAAVLVKRIALHFRISVASLTRCHMCRLPTQKLITNSTKNHAVHTTHSCTHTNACSTLFICLSTLLCASSHWLAQK